MLFLIAGGYTLAALASQTFDEINDFGRRFCENKNQKRFSACRAIRVLASRQNRERGQRERGYAFAS